MNFNKKQHGELTILDIVLTLCANAKSYNQFREWSGLDNNTASAYWMQKYD